MNVIDRFVGNVAWSRLDDLQRVAIGSIVLEQLAAWYAQEQAADLMDASDPLLRAADAADTKLMGMLHEILVEAIPREMLEVDGQPRLPSLLGAVCRRCGRSLGDGCFPPCGWAEPDHLCTSCADAILFDDEAHCPGHVASAVDPKVCAHCGVHIDDLRPDDPINLQGSGPGPIEPRDSAELIDGLDPVYGDRSGGRCAS